MSKSYQYDKSTRELCIVHRKATNILVAVVKHVQNVGSENKKSGLLKCSRRENV